MEEKLDRIEKNISDLIEIVIAVKDNLEDFRDETNKKFEAIDRKFEQVDTQFEIVNGKINGLHRAVDSAFERQSDLDTRVTKIESGLYHS
jgi:archaellum component FlaC